MAGPPNAPRDPAREARLARLLDGAPGPSGERSRTIGCRVHAYASVGSTMDVARRLAQEGALEGTLILAARQEQGRGRLGRVWESPEGGLYASLILAPARPAAEIPQLSLVTGLAAAQAIHELTGLFPAIRWPNDLLLNDRKVGGILVETTAEGGRQRAEGRHIVIVGVGINVKTPQEDLPDTATSLASAGTIDCDADTLAAALCRALAAWYDAWSRRGFAPIREALRPWISVFGHPVQITTGSDQTQGTATDLDESGRLLVRLDSGVIRPFEMGEVTLLR